MAAAYYARRKQCGQCPQGRPGPQSRVFSVVCCLVWAGVWLWFGARTLRLARRILACQQFGSACSVRQRLLPRSPSLAEC